MIKKEEGKLTKKIWRKITDWTESIKMACAYNYLIEGILATIFVVGFWATIVYFLFFRK